VAACGTRWAGPAPQSLHTAIHSASSGSPAPLPIVRADQQFAAAADTGGGCGRLVDTVQHQHRAGVRPRRRRCGSGSRLIRGTPRQIRDAYPPARCIRPGHGAALPMARCTWDAHPSCVSHRSEDLSCTSPDSEGGLVYWSRDWVLTCRTPARKLPSLTHRKAHWATTDPTVLLSISCYGRVAEWSIDRSLGDANE